MLKIDYDQEHKEQCKEWRKMTWHEDQVVPKYILELTLLETTTSICNEIILVISNMFLELGV